MRSKFPSRIAEAACMLCDVVCPYAALCNFLADCLEDTIVAYRIVYQGS